MTENKQEKKEPIVKGEIMRPKDSKIKAIYHIFFAAEPTEAIRNVIAKVLFPNIQYTLNSMWKRFGDTMFYGVDDKAAPRSRRDERHNYQRHYRNDDRAAFQNENNTDCRGTRIDEIKEWGYTRKSDAEDIVLTIRDELNEYEVCDIGKVLEEMGLTPDPIHYKWGWIKGDVFDPDRNVEMGRDGYWHINYPRIRKL